MVAWFDSRRGRHTFLEYDLMLVDSDPMSATARPKATIFDTCLQITSTFEGASYGTITGNFDGMGMSAGILQFNVGTGSLQTYILNHINPMSYSFPMPITPLIERPVPEALAWFKSTNLDKNGRLKPEWRRAWRDFMLRPEVVNLQRRACDRYFHRAREIVGALGFKQTNVRAMAWAYDVAVQSWSLGIESPQANREQAQNILSLYGNENFMLWQPQDLSTDQVRLVIASHLRALRCRPEFKIDFFTRKCTIAVGIGIVHKTRRDFRELLTEY